MTNVICHFLIALDMHWLELLFRSPHPTEGISDCVLRSQGTNQSTPTNATKVLFFKVDRADNKENRKYAGDT